MCDFSVDLQVENLQQCYSSGKHQQHLTEIQSFNQVVNVKQQPPVQYFPLALFQGPCPASRRLQDGKALPHCTRREAGQGPGNEANFPHLAPPCIFF